MSTTIVPPMEGVQSVITAKDQTGGLNTVFDDVNPTKVTTEEESVKSLREYKDMSDGLSKFLSRAISISNTTWSAASSGLYLTLDPWSYLAANVPVIEKVKYFSTVKGKLHIRIITNGTQFHYGRMVVSYVPFYSAQSANYRNKYLQTPLIFQVQNVEINPTTSEPVEMVLDMFTDVDSIGLQAQTLTSLEDMGRLLFTVLTPLQSANVAVPDPVTIQVYAWWEEVGLGVPTPYPDVMQAGGELVSKGPISKISSAVASTASMFKDVPIIGRFAMATEIGARAIGGIASIFGYSNPTVVDRYNMYKTVSAANYCQTTGRDSSKVFTFDPLRELSIDPKSVGFPNRDEMSFSYLYKIPFYMRGISWTTAQTPGTLLALVGVSPNATWQSIPVAGSIDHAMAPIQMLSKMAECWTGSLKFRFKVVCSPYHKGRLLFRYHPYRQGTTVRGFGEVTSQSVVFDIGLNSEKELVVDWSRPNLWITTGAASLPADSTLNSNTALGGATAVCPSYCNGEISVEVLTELTAPVLTAPVTIHVFMEGTDSLRFSNWNFTNISTPGTAVCQAGGDPMEMEMGEVKSTRLGMQEGFSSDILKVTMGEDVASLRSLLKRPAPMGFRYPEAAPATAMTNVYAGLFTSYPLILPNPSATTQVCEKPYQTPYQVWTNAYAARKGSVRYKIVRYNRSVGTLQNSLLQRTFGWSAPTAKTNLSGTGIPSPWGTAYNLMKSQGWAQLNPTEGVVEFEIPDSNQKKYYLTTVLPSIMDTITLADYFSGYTDTTVYGDNILYEVLFSTGEDNSLFYFTGCPLLRTGPTGWNNGGFFPTRIG